MSGDLCKESKVGLQEIAAAFLPHVSSTPTTTAFRQTLLLKNLSDRTVE
ncbi:MAG: hypothetical protein ACFE0J_09505 [Elainellaceae cyanobacterium]